jgi:hypothetical protein
MNHTVESVDFLIGTDKKTKFIIDEEMKQIENV